MEFIARAFGVELSIYLGPHTDDADEAVDAGPALTLIDGGQTGVELGFRTPALWDEPDDE